MNDLNSVTLIGRLTRDMELKYLQTGVAVGTMSIAVNRSVKKNEQWVDEASFFDVTLFGKSAENLRQYLLKGKQVAVQGSLKQDRWEKDGQKFSRVGIIADAVQLLGGQSQGNAQPQNNYQQQTSYTQPPVHGGNGWNERNVTPARVSVTTVADAERNGYGTSEDFPETIPF